MIKLNGVNKYFNRFRSNQIHVINNTNLEFNEKGLVSLLGPSGCGKTTLLNSIGGLDKINKGQIYIDGERITGRSSSKIDKIRNLNIGYIFQDYNLINDMSVYDNVSLVLKMLGIKNKKEINSRVNYILDVVGMYRFRNRPCSMLSGGQRQRVGIARAIVKNPKIIIADEPTGNLDSGNSLEVMNIIKSISKNKLVILVTHEKDLAYFYSDRIIEILDGKVINDKINDSDGELDKKLDNRLYLKDYKNKETFKNKESIINFYNSNDEDINLDIVVENGNLYIRSNNKRTIQMVDDYSSYEFVNEEYKKIKKSDSEKYKFDLTKLDNSNIKLRYTSIFNPITSFINGFKKILDYSFIKKVLLLGFFAAGMFILYSVSNIFGILDVEEKDFIKTNRNYLTIKTDKLDINKYLDYENNYNFEYLLPGNSMINLTLKDNNFYQTKYFSMNLFGSLADINMVNKDELIEGNLPENKNEILIDKLLIEKYKITNEPKQINILNYKDYIGRIVSNKFEDYKIVGIVNTSSPCIYADKEKFIDLIYFSENSTSDNSQISFYDFSLEKNISLKKGLFPLNDYEVMVNIDKQYEIKLNSKINDKINNINLKVVGYYYSQENNDKMYVNKNMIKYKLISSSKDLTIYTKNKEEIINKLHNNNINIIDNFNVDKEKYTENVRKTMKVTMIICFIILIISFVEIYLIVRASFLSRVKQIGIYRAIGVKKRDIYKMFLGEILAITIIACLPGFIFMYFIISKLTEISLIKSMFLLDTKVILISLCLIFSFNIIVGLIPVRKIVRKTPANILSRNDTD